MRKYRLRRSALLAILFASTLAAPLAHAQTIAPAQNSAIVPAPFQPARHAQFVEIAKQGDIDLLLMGDSITDWWRTTGLAVFDRNFADIKTANFGISGDRTQGVLWRMENGELEGYTPKLMMLMIGTNNLSGGARANTPEQIAEGITAVVNKFRAKFPNAKVLLLGIFPRGAMPASPMREPIKQINASIAKLDDGKNVRFMDIGAKFLESDGSISVEVMRDGLHPTAKGYEIWASAVMPTIREMMGKE
jgi:lysophospholipase L1-like esterase